MKSHSPRVPALVAAAAALALTAVYLPSLGSFFASDDWVLVYYYGQIPLSRFWEYFSPHAVWFYRPLQSAQFGLFYHLFRLDPVPYNVSLLAMHLGVCALAYALVADLSGRPWLAALTTALFAAQWVYVDLLFWKANFNTLQWALVTLGACLAFSRWLRTGRPSWRWTAYALCVLNLFTKESAVSTPFLLLLIWAYYRLRREELTPQRWWQFFPDTARAVGPAVAIAGVYTALHPFVVKDVYVFFQKPGYAFSPPLRALAQAAFLFDHTLLSPYPNPLVAPGSGGDFERSLKEGLQLAVTGVPPGSRAPLPGPTPLLLLPVLLAALAWRWRDRFLFFSLGFLLFSAVPVVFLASFHASRFYYLPALGAAMVLASLAERGWRAGGCTRHAGWVRGAVLALGIYFAAANVGMTQTYVREDAAKSATVEAAYEFLTTQRGQLEPAPLIVLKNAPPTFFNNGLGAREMAKLALQDPGAEGVLLNQGGIDPRRLAQLQAIPSVYELDLNGAPLALRQVRSSRPINKPIPPGR